MSFELIKKSVDAGTFLADRRSILIETKTPHEYLFFEAKQPEIPASELAMHLGVSGWKLFRAVCTIKDGEIDYCWGIAVKPDYTNVEFVEGKAKEIGL